MRKKADRAVVGQPVFGSTLEPEFPAFAIVRGLAERQYQLLCEQGRCQEDDPVPQALLEITRRTAAEHCPHAQRHQGIAEDLKADRPERGVDLAGEPRAPVKTGDKAEPGDKAQHGVGGRSLYQETDDQRGVVAGRDSGQAPRGIFAQTRHRRSILERFPEGHRQQVTGEHEEIADADIPVHDESAELNQRRSQRLGRKPLQGVVPDDHQTSQRPDCICTFQCLHLSSLMSTGA